MSVNIQVESILIEPRIFDPACQVFASSVSYWTNRCAIVANERRGLRVPLENIDKTSKD
jgi:hypothetical protein